MVLLKYFSLYYDVSSPTRSKFRQKRRKPPKAKTETIYMSYDILVGKPHHLKIDSTRRKIVVYIVDYKILGNNTCPLVDFIHMSQMNMYYLQPLQLFKFRCTHESSLWFGQ